MVIKISIHYCLAIVFFLTLFSCKQGSKQTESAKERMRISFDVIPEDHEKNLYYVEWKDTLGHSEGYTGDKQLKRPKEVWCVITNDSKDTLGYYKGLSTARTFAGFQSMDTIVYLHFMIGLNVFTDKFDKRQVMSGQMKAIHDYALQNKLPVIFKPVQINLKTDLRKRHSIELQEQ